MARFFDSVRAIWFWMTAVFALPVSPYSDVHDASSDCAAAHRRFVEAERQVEDVMDAAPAVRGVATRRRNAAFKDLQKVKNEYADICWGKLSTSLALIRHFLEDLRS